LNPPFLSIVIPAHNEETRLPPSLAQVFEFLQKQSYSAEVLVVENGSVDKTLEVARSFTARYPMLRVLHEDRRGKGLAVQRGILEAQGAYRFICDADLSMPVVEVNRFIPPQLASLDIAIASREVPGSVRYNEPLYRHWGGRGVNLLIRLLALPGLRDTQCGFKCFRAEVAEDIFRHQTITGISFDPEVLYIARRHGYSIVEIPVPWYYSSESRIHLFQDTLSLVHDLLTIRKNAHRGVYDAHS